MGYRSLIAQTIQNLDGSAINYPLREPNWTNLSEEHFAIDPQEDILKWDVSRRNYQLIYYPINPRNAEEVTISFEIQFKGWQANNEIQIGLVESFTPMYMRGQYPSGLFVTAGRFGAGTRYVNDFMTFTAGYLDADRKTYMTWNAPYSFISYEYNQWYQVELRLNNLEVHLRLMDLEGNILRELSGTLPRHHTSFNYFALFNYHEGDWMTGYGDFRSLHIR